MGVHMRNVIIGMVGAFALLTAGMFAWNAETTPLTPAAADHPGVHYSLVENAQSPSCPDGAALICTDENDDATCSCYVAEKDDPAVVAGCSCPKRRIVCGSGTCRCVKKRC